jgi:hypothetical protein
MSHVCHACGCADALLFIGVSWCCVECGTDAAQYEYTLRRDRLTNPSGRFDHAGRWYPSVAERCACCASVRSPSHAYPYSLMTHCRTLKHVKQLIAKHAMDE